MSMTMLNSIIYKKALLPYRCCIYKRPVEALDYGGRFDVPLFNTPTSCKVIVKKLPRATTDAAMRGATIAENKIKMPESMPYFDSKIPKYNRNVIMAYQDSFRSDEIVWPPKVGKFEEPNRLLRNIISCWMSRTLF